MRASSSAFTAEASGRVETVPGTTSTPVLVPSALAGVFPSAGRVAADKSGRTTVGLSSSLTVLSAVSGDDPHVQLSSRILSPTILKSVRVRLFSSLLLPLEKLPDAVLRLSRP